MEKFVVHCASHGPVYMIEAKYHELGKEHLAFAQCPLRAGSRPCMHDLVVFTQDEWDDITDAVEDISKYVEELREAKDNLECAVRRLRDIADDDLVDEVEQEYLWDFAEMTR